MTRLEEIAAYMQRQWSGEDTMHVEAVDGTLVVMGHVLAYRHQGEIYFNYAGYDRQGNVYYVDWRAGAVPHAPAKREYFVLPSDPWELPTDDEEEILRYCGPTESFSFEHKGQFYRVQYRGMADHDPAFAVLQLYVTADDGFLELVMPRLDEITDEEWAADTDLRNAARRYIVEERRARAA